MRCPDMKTTRHTRPFTAAKAAGQRSCHHTAQAQVLRRLCRQYRDQLADFDVGGMCRTLHVHWRQLRMMKSASGLRHVLSRVLSLCDTGCARMAEDSFGASHAQPDLTWPSLGMLRRRQRLCRVTNLPISPTAGSAQQLLPQWQQRLWHVRQWLCHHRCGSAAAVVAPHWPTVMTACVLVWADTSGAISLCQAFDAAAHASGPCHGAD